MKQRILTLFLSYQGSLKRWEQEGILSREILPYIEFIRTGAFEKIQMFSYDYRDPAFMRSFRSDPFFDKVYIIAPRRSLGGSWIKNILWSVIGPLVHRQSIGQSTVLKTNQISGCWSAVIAYGVTRRPLVVRMGYILSRRFGKNRQVFRAAAAWAIEQVAFKMAARLLVTSHAAISSLAAKGHAKKTILIPSYVNVNQFRAKRKYHFTEPLVTVSRLTPQKNLANLIRACAAINMSLVIYGTGPQGAELRHLAKKIGARVTFPGIMPNGRLAGELLRHSIFVLPSLHEGLPKALIEAMACGLICVGTDISGTTDLIENGKTGYLINGFRACDIARTLRCVLDQHNPEIGRAARKFVENNHSLEYYVAREAKIYADLR